MKTTTSLISLASLAAASASFAAVPNTGEQRAYVGSLYMGNESLRQSSSFLNGLLAGTAGVSAGGNYADYDFDDDTDRRFEGDFETMSGSIGYLHEFEGFNIGVAATFVESDFEADSTTTNPGVVETDGDGWILTLGASKTWERLALSVKGSVGELSFDSTRSNAFAPKNSDYDLSMYQFELVGEYAAITKEEFDLSPFAKLGYISLENDGFAESNSADDISFGDYEDDLPYAELGVKATLKTLGSFAPYATASVWQDLGDDEVELEGAGVNPIDVPDVAETVIKAGLGFGWMANDSWTFGGQLGFFSGDEVDGFILGLSGTYSF